MKTKTLFLLGVFTLSISCERLPTGPSDCYFYVYNRIDEIEKDYNYEMTHVVDSEGYSNSLEACIMQRNLTYSYIAELDLLIPFLFLFFEFVAFVLFWKILLSLKIGT